MTSSPGSGTAAGAAPAAVPPPAGSGTTSAATGGPDPYVWADPVPVTGYPEWRVAYWDGTAWVTVEAPTHPRNAEDIAVAYADEFPVEIWRRLPGQEPVLYRRLGPTSART